MAGTQVKFAIYSDAGNTPGNFLASTNSVTVGSTTGLITATIASPPAGLTVAPLKSYWILMASNSTNYVGYNNVSGGQGFVQSSAPYAGAFPQLWSTNGSVTNVKNYTMYMTLP